MAFPLTGAALTAAAITVPPPLSPTTQVTVTSRSWAQPGGSLWTRARSTSQIVVSVGTVPVKTVLVQRRWAGLGGTIALPSFPQLDRNNTTFPHAT